MVLCRDSRPCETRAKQTLPSMRIAGQRASASKPGTVQEMRHHTLDTMPSMEETLLPLSEDVPLKHRQSQETPKTAPSTHCPAACLVASVTPKA